MGKGIHTALYLKGVEKAGVGASGKHRPWNNILGRSNGGPLSPRLFLLFPSGFHTTLSNTTLRRNSISSLGAARIESPQPVLVTLHPT